MRSIAAEGSAGDGGVVATVNGYGALVGMRIAPEMLADVPRLA
jgi:DNA-binding protein YbaB